METGQLKGIIEAALLAYGQPLGIEQLREIFDEFERPDASQVRKALVALADDCEGRPVELVEVASGFRLQVRKEFSARLSRLWQERPTRYSRALLETLALTERGWIRVVGHREVPGHPELLGTTRDFLDYFGLRSLDELPSLAALRDMDDVGIQLEFDEPVTVQAAPADQPAANDADALS
jgi:segregation and condensation protein B